MAAALGGCGGSGEAPNPSALALRRQDLVAVARALSAASGPVAAEVAEAKRAWPVIANGLPRVSAYSASPASAAAASAAAASAAKIAPLAPLGETQARSLTGPAAGVAGMFSNYVLLASRGWRMIAAAASSGESASPAATRFARENVALYIESVYDAHFTLAQIGRKLSSGYRELGGPAQFGSALTAAQVSALEHTYSEASDRLRPHAGVRLGS